MKSLWSGVVVLLDATDRAVAAELVALQRASYAVEAELIGFDRIPALRESVEGLVAAGLVWLGVLEGSPRPPGRMVRWSPRPSIDLLPCIDTGPTGVHPPAWERSHQGGS